MTKDRINKHLLSTLSSFGINTVSFEMKKNKLGAVLVAMNVVGISDLSEEEITLISHGGRVKVRGYRLELSVLEDKSVEIFGKICEVGFEYGKNC